MKSKIKLWILKRTEKVAFKERLDRAVGTALNVIRAAAIALGLVAVMVGCMALLLHCGQFEGPWMVVLFFTSVNVLVYAGIGFCGIIARTIEMEQEESFRRQCLAYPGNARIRGALDFARKNGYKLVADHRDKQPVDVDDRHEFSQWFKGSVIELYNAEKDQHIVISANGPVRSYIAVDRIGETLSRQALTEYVKSDTATPPKHVYIKNGSMWNVSMFDKDGFQIGGVDMSEKRLSDVVKGAVNYSDDILWSAKG